MAVAAHHVVLLPFPIPGHYLPISAFAHSLALCCSNSSDAGNFLVTLILTEAVAQKWQQRQGLQQAGGDGDDKVQVQIVAVSDGMPLDFDRAANYPTLLHTFQEMGPSVQQCVEKLHVSCPISCLISDPYFPWMEAVANHFSLPLFLFFTDSAAVVAALLHTRRLLSDGLIGPGSVGKADVMVDDIPGMPALPARSLPFPPHEMEFLFNLRAKAEKLMQKAAGLLINTFCELEEEAVGFARRNLSKPVLAVGPCLPESMVISGKAATPVEGAEAEDEEELMQWLDAHPPASVMYVSFGSLVNLPDVETKEVWEGLRASKQPFLWATRSKLASILAAEVTGVEQQQQQGRVVEWAPQQQVLTHPAVGGFMTHCGWNAALEGIAAGVPMLCCPQFIDQPLTSALIVQEWRMGLQLAAGPLERAAVERHVRLILGDQEEGKSLRHRADKLREAAVVALRSLPAGSSTQNLHSLIKQDVEI